MTDSLRLESFFILPTLRANNIFDICEDSSYLKAANSYRYLEFLLIFNFRVFDKSIKMLTSNSYKKIVN